jgi:hypothetical protein
VPSIADPRRRALLLVGASLAASLVYFRAELLAGGPGLPLDDSWIHLQFARSVAAGEGLSYRDGELVAGSTAPLWTAVLSLVFLLPVPPLLGVKVLGVGLLAGLAVAVDALAGELGLRPGLRLLAGLLVVATDWMAWAALSGMEILLFTLLATWGLVLWGRARAGPGRGLPRALVVLAAASLARPEGLLLLALAVVDELARMAATGTDGFERAARALRLVGGVGLAFLIVAPVGLVYASIQGSPLPGTLAVKTDGIERLVPSLRHLYAFVGILFRPQPWMLLFAGAGVVRLAERWGSERDRGLLPGLWLLALPLAYSTLSPVAGAPLAGNFGRYLFPLLPPMIVLGALGLEPIARRVARLRPVAVRRALLLLLAVLLFAPSLLTLVSGASRYASSVHDVEASDVAAARWISRNLPPQALLAVQDVGAVGYLTPNPILDLAGIVTPEILPYVKGDRIGAHPSRLGGLAEFVRAAEAEYLLLFPSAYGGIGALSSVLPGLEPVRAWRLERNITMAGSELVLFTTPWSGRRAEPASTSQPEP